MLRKHVLRAGLAALVATALTACGSSGNDPSEFTKDLKGDPIKLGIIGTFSGVSGQSHVAAKPALQAWANSVNEAGGIDGRPIVVVAADDKGDPATAANAAKRLVEKDKVVAIVGEHSASANGWAEYIASKNIPVIGGYSNAPEMVSYPNWFSTGGNIASNFWAIANEGAKSGDKMAMLYCAEVPACKAASTILESFGKEIGVDVAYTAGVAGDSSDFTAFCLAMKDAGVSSYNMSVASAVNQRVAEQCGQLGFKAQLIQVGDTANSQRQEQPIYNGTKFVGNTPGYFLDSTPAQKEFHDALKKYSPDLGSDSVPMSASAFEAWAAGKLFEAAVAASGSDEITSETLFEGLYALKGETLDGLTVPLTYTKGQPTLFNVYYPFVLEDGKWVAEDDGNPVFADDAVSKQIAEIAKGFAPK